VLVKRGHNNCGSGHLVESKSISKKLNGAGAAAISETSKMAHMLSCVTNLVM
jgi:hypothetical protein